MSELYLPLPIPLYCLWKCPHLLSSLQPRPCLSSVFCLRRVGRVLCFTLWYSTCVIFSFFLAGLCRRGRPFSTEELGTFLEFLQYHFVPLREHSQGQLNRQPRMLLTAARLFFPEDAFFFEFEGCLLPTCFRWEDAVSDLAVVSSSSEDREGIAVSLLPSLKQSSPSSTLHGSEGDSGLSWLKCPVSSVMKTLFLYECGKL